MSTLTIIESSSSANMYMCPEEGIWCGNGTQCERGNGSNGTVAQLHDWNSGTILHLANNSVAMGPSGTASASAATSSSCIAGVCLSTVKCLPISVPIGVGAGVGLPLVLCVIVLAVMLKREKRKRGSILVHKESKESGLRLDAMAYGETHRDMKFKWNRNEYAPDAHMLGGQQVHELETHSYELPPSRRAK